MPFTLSPALAAKLYQALLERDVWYQGELVKLDEGKAIKLPVRVIKRARQDGKPGVRFEFIYLNRSVGEGKYGGLWKVAGTLQADRFKAAGSLNKAGQVKERVIKIQTHSERYPASKVTNEYQLARRANHLHIKQPAVYTNMTGVTSSYLVMQRMPGVDLLTVVNKISLAPEKRFELSIALLQALKDQVHHHGVIHRDIKPENIMVNLDSHPVTVNIVDFGLSIDAQHLDGESPGNFFYAAPEQRNGNPYKHCGKMDVYAMTRIIALLWGVSSHSYRDPIDYNRSVTDLLTNLFTGVSGLSDLQKDGILHLLTLGLEPLPEKRIDLDYFLAEFQYLSLNPLVAKAPVASSSSVPTPSPEPPTYSNAPASTFFSPVLSELYSNIAAAVPDCSLL